MKLHNNTILITGGTSGIGLGLALRLKTLGNEVIVTGTNESRLINAKNEGLSVYPCDLSNTGEIEKLVMHIERHFPSLNMLINNAAVQYNYGFEGNIVPLEKINKEFEVNAIGHITITHLLLPLLNSKTNAMIINTTSALGLYPKSNGLVYSATKAAMRSFTTGLRHSLSNTNIKVLEFMPPVTNTGMTTGRDEKKMDVKTLIDRTIPQIEKERKCITLPSLVFFKWISILTPKIAQKIVN